MKGEDDSSPQESTSWIIEQGFNAAGKTNQVFFVLSPFFLLVDRMAF